MPDTCASERASSAAPDRGASAAARGVGPRRAEATVRPLLERPGFVEQALAVDVASTLGPRFDHRRFIPGVLMHEFEALLFSDCAVLAGATGRSDLTAGFQAIRDEFETPEQIDDAPALAPSKRILALAPEYRKLVDGVRAAERIGIQRIRAACPHFNDWLNRIEELAAASRT